MKKYIVFSVICAVACWSNSFAQYPDWINYTSGQGVYALADNGNELWIRTDGGGLAKFDGSNWTVYNESNSGLPHSEVLALAIDGSNIWIGTYEGLAKFDGTNWTVYDIYNSGLPDNCVRSLAIDGSNIWIGTYYGGLAEFDGTNWTVYNTSNSDLPDNEVLALAIDGSNIWVGIWGLAKFDGTNWTVYDTSNSGLPYDRVYALAIDGSDNIWIGTYGGGLAKFDGTNWTVYGTGNSGLPHGLVLSLAIDGSNIWIGTWGGLAKFDGSNWTVYNTSNSGLPDNWVFGLAIDGSDNIWIGTWLGGLAVYPRSLVQYVLTISAGTGGTTNPSPGDHSYDAETQVTIRAIPSSGYEFSSWSGDASGTSSTITITMDSDKSVTATFSTIPSGGTEDGDGGGKKGGCFIATATYSSPLHPYVEILQDFRDKYLMPCKLGRSLVKLYYKYSPFVADLITKHKVLKVPARIILLPVIAFSYSMLHFSPAITVVMLVLIFALPILFIASYRKKLMRVEAKDPKALASRRVKKAAGAGDS